MPFERYRSSEVPVSALPASGSRVEKTIWLPSAEASTRLLLWIVASGADIRVVVEPWRL